MSRIKNSPNPERLRGVISAPGVSALLPHPNEIARISPWEIDFRQTSSGPMQTSVNARATPNLSLMRLRLDGRVHQRGVAPTGWSTFGLVPSHHLRTWQGQPVAPDALLCFGDGLEFDSVSEASFDGLVVSFRAARLLEIADAFGLDPNGKIERPSQVVPTSNASDLSHLANGVLGMLATKRGAWTEEQEDALYLQVLAVLGDARQLRDTSKPSYRRVALARALDVFEAFPDEPVRIAELCRLTGVSWRTLDRAFHDTYGCGPKAYHTRMRLGRVRHDLLSATMGFKVADAANRQGFWHMGQFAQDYRRFFGELPSETRARVS